MHDDDPNEEDQPFDGEDLTAEEAAALNREAREQLERNEREEAREYDRLAAMAPEGEGEQWERKADEWRRRADETAAAAEGETKGDGDA
jgi:hypothetical protein